VTREQRTVFGEVAEVYERTRPGYPDALFDAIVEFGELRPGDRALEIGAGTGKATRSMAERGLDITAIEPSAGMAALLAQHTPATVVESTFEAWTPEPDACALVYAAQSWHWVADHAAAYERVATALRPQGTIALFWNLPRELTGALGDAIQDVYRRLAPELESMTTQWPLDDTLAEMDGTGLFTKAQKRTFTWERPYTTDEYVELMSTHSNHRMLEPEHLVQMQAAVRDVVEQHGGTVDVVYDVNAYFARRR
jgi:trans-aconitate methyltransferase